jgi:hypothetical protein
MGQVGLARPALAHVSDKGSITPTSSLLAQRPMRGSSAVWLVNAGLEGFVRGRARSAAQGCA